MLFRAQVTELDLDESTGKDALLAEITARNPTTKNNLFRGFFWGMMDPQKYSFKKAFDLICCCSWFGPRGFWWKMTPEETPGNLKIDEACKNAKRHFFCWADSSNPRGISEISIKQDASAYDLYHPQVLKLRVQLCFLGFVGLLTNSYWDTVQVKIEVPQHQEKMIYIFSFFPTDQSYFCLQKMMAVAFEPPIFWWSPFSGPGGSEMLISACRRTGGYVGRLAQFFEAPAILLVDWLVCRFSFRQLRAILGMILVFSPESY